MTLRYATDIHDVAQEDIISLEELANWLRDLADPDLWSDDESEREHQREVADEAMKALVETLTYLGIHDIDPTDPDVIARALEHQSSQGATYLIADSYWEDYARQEAQETSDEWPELSDRWPFNCIDWARAATELATDFDAPDLDGVTFYIRTV